MDEVELEKRLRGAKKTQLIRLLLRTRTLPESTELQDRALVHFAAVGKSSTRERLLQINDNLRRSILAELERRGELVLDQKCPHCTAEMDALTAVSDKALLPKPGDITLCWICGEWCEFDEELGLTKPREATLESIGDDPTCLRVREMWAREHVVH